MERILVALVALVAWTYSPAGKLPGGYRSENVDPIAYLNTEGRSPFKMAITEKDGRWYLYVGNVTVSGWSIIDVTDPVNPQIVNFIKGPAENPTKLEPLMPDITTFQTEIGGHYFIGGMQVNVWKEQGEQDSLGDRAGLKAGIRIYDIQDPVNPKLVGEYFTSGHGTHRNFYDGGRYVHLTSYEKGFEGGIYVILDISDPENPVEAGRWWVKGQHVAAGEVPPEPLITLHGPPYVEGNHAWLSYGSAGMIILDISDVSAPREIGRLDFSPPFEQDLTVHTVLPIPDRKLALTNSEVIHERCQDALTQASIVDVSDLSKLRLIALFPQPRPTADMPYTSFCGKGGRFGPHNINQHQHSPFVEPQGNLVYMTYVNAGLRIFDISDPRAPTEVGWFIPPDPKERWFKLFVTDLALGMEDVLVDRRGFIYTANWNQGIWILRYTGPR